MEPTPAVAEAGSGPIEALYRAEGPRLHRSLMGSFGRRDLADEAVAETFAQLLRGGDAVRSPKAWVWRTAFAIARGLAAQPTSTNVVPEQTWVDDDAPLDLLAALARLPERQREAVVLRHWAGFTAVEIGRLTDTDPATVRMRLARGRRRLRNQLERP